MTFGRLIAEALEELIIPADAQDAFIWRHRVERLAPRVAAAIAAAHGSQGNKARELLQQAALEALRGERGHG